MKRDIEVLISVLNAAFGFLGNLILSKSYNITSRQLDMLEMNKRGSSIFSVR